MKMSLIEAPSRTVLDATPGRAVTFLIGVNASVEVRVALMARGYSQAEHEQMWSLIGRLTALPTATVHPRDEKVEAALTELNDWDEPNFAVITTILQRKFPAQAAFVFQDLAPSPIAAQAVVSIATLLDRFDALEKSPDRKSTRKVDHEALERLSERGYTKEERKRLRALVTTAQKVSAVEVVPVSSEEADAIKLELYGFLNEWTTQAKAVIKRRDLLIRLGIGKRKKRTAAAPVPAPVPGPAPSPGTAPNGSVAGSGAPSPAASVASTPAGNGAPAASTGGTSPQPAPAPASPAPANASN
jgi:hypothetical protein